MVIRGISRMLLAFLACGALAQPAFAQANLSGSWVPRLYEDYIKRGPGGDLADFTGLPLNDAARALALLYAPNVPFMVERQCLNTAPWVLQFHPRGLSVWADLDDNAEVRAWVIGGNHLYDTLTIWMDGRRPPSSNAYYPQSGFTTGKWEGNTLTARTTNVKAAWVERGTGIPSSDRATFTIHITRHEDLLTTVTIQEDPVYLTEPHVVSRVWQLDPSLSPGNYSKATCNTASELPRLEDSGIVPHYLPGQNPQADFMMRTYNLPREAAMGYAHTLYPEYRKTIRGTYVPPASCGRYCCGWIERQGLPGAAPTLTCQDGGQRRIDAAGTTTSSPKK